MDRSENRCMGTLSFRERTFLGHTTTPSSASGTWTYMRNGTYLLATWRDFEDGADLLLQTDARVESRYFDSLDDLLVYHAVLDRLLREARWLPVDYVSTSVAAGTPLGVAPEPPLRSWSRRSRLVQQVTSH
jgi:hypothetical protein